MIDEFCCLSCIISLAGNKKSKLLFQSFIFIMSRMPAEIKYIVDIVEAYLSTSVVFPSPATPPKNPLLLRCIIHLASTLFFYSKGATKLTRRNQYVDVVV